uniref:Ephrin_rec_like domain-containing protein n=1 Tax=Macrostomum lignano TaxID=282301 RepID=A0A1I8F6U9_9PLAT
MTDTECQEFVAKSVSLAIKRAVGSSGGVCRLSQEPPTEVIAHGHHSLLIMAACLKLHVLPLLAPVVLQLVICLATDAISFGLSSGSKKRTPATVTGARTRATKKRSFANFLAMEVSSPFDTETNSPFMFLYCANAVRWNITGQSIDLRCPLGLLESAPAALTDAGDHGKPQALKKVIGRQRLLLSVKYDWECCVGTYSSDWGSVDCHECPPSYTTRKVGSTKQFELHPVATYKMENNIKELLTYFGVDESDEYKKFTMLAVFLLSPWLVFVICLLVSLAYGYSEVTDSEKRSNSKRELGSILLRIRRNYNVLMAEHQRL